LGKGIFNGGEAGYPGYLKNDQQLNKKQVISTESKKQH